MGRGRSCEGCGRRWPVAARWCGACGRPLVTLDDTTATVDGRVPAPLLVITAVLVAAALVVGPRTSSRTDGVQLAPPETAIAEPRTSTADEVETIADGPVCRGPNRTVSCVDWDVPFPARSRIDATVLGDLVVTVATDGRVTARSVDTGAPRWTHRLDVPAAPTGGPPTLRDPRRLSAPVGVLADVAGMLAVRSGSEITFLERVVGGVSARVVAPVDPVETAVVDAWLLLTDGRRIANLLANGISTWTIDVPEGATAAVTSHGPYLVEGRRVTQVSKVAGLTRWRAELDGPVRPLDAVADDAGLFAVDGDRPAIVALAEADGEPRWQLPLPGVLVELTVDEHRLVAVSEGPGGVEVSVATLRTGASAQRWSGRLLLGPGVGGVQTPATAGDAIAVAAAEPDPTLWVARLDGRLLVRERLATVPYGIGLPDPQTLLVADVTGVRARAVGTATERWRVGLRSARLLADDPPVVAADRGITRLRPRPSRSASPPVRSGG